MYGYVDLLFPQYRKTEIYLQCRNLFLVTDKSVYCRKESEGWNGIFFLRGASCPGLYRCPQYLCPNNAWKGNPLGSPVDYGLHDQDSGRLTREA